MHIPHYSIFELTLWSVVHLFYFSHKQSSSSSYLTLIEIPFVNLFEQIFYISNKEQDLSFETWKRWKNLQRIKTYSSRRILSQINTTHMCSLFISFSYSLNKNLIWFIRNNLIKLCCIIPSLFNQTLPYFTTCIF